MKMSSVVVCTIKLVGTIFVVLQFDLLFSNYSGVVAVAAKHVACIQKERHALLELKASFVLDDSNLLPSWDSKSDGCCAWEGIGCSNQTGHVEMLDLNGDQVIPFRGKINRSVIDLQNLKYLNLSFNRMSNDNFPELFGSLRNLRFLDLQSSFRGGRIPNDLARLSHLQYLDLSWNGLKGTIPHQFGNLSHLQHLDLSSNYGVAGTIPHQLGNLSHLHYLDLSSNFLVGTIPHQLGSLSNLQELHLEYNEGLKVQDQNNHAGEKGANYAVQISNVEILPNPVVRGEPFTFKIKAYTGEPILSGDLIYEISFAGIEGQPAIFHHALSEETPLPVTPGHFLLTHTELLPPVTPPGTYNVKLTFKDQNDKQLTCVVFPFTIGAKSSVSAI